MWRKKKKEKKERKKESIKGRNGSINAKGNCDQVSIQKIKTLHTT
jgi:hypothetical protein